MLFLPSDKILTFPGEKDTNTVLILEHDHFITLITKLKALQNQKIKEYSVLNILFSKTES